MRRFVIGNGLTSLVACISDVARQLETSLKHPGHPKSGGRKTVEFRLVEGPAVLGEAISVTISGRLWDHISRAVTPEDGRDCGLSKAYFKKTAILAILLAKLFASVPSFRPCLWREVEDILIKGLFSGPDPEPGAFVAVTALIALSTTQIEEYLSEEGHVGQGKDWVWYNNIRAEDESWSWAEVVEGVQNAKIAPLLMGDVGKTFQFAKNILDGKMEDSDWELVEVFPWLA